MKKLLLIGLVFILFMPILNAQQKYWNPAEFPEWDAIADDYLIVPNPEITEYYDSLVDILNSDIYGDEIHFRSDNYTLNFSENILNVGIRNRNFSNWETVNIKFSRPLNDIESNVETLSNHNFGGKILNLKNNLTVKGKIFVPGLYKELTGYDSFVFEIRFEDIHGHEILGKNSENFVFFNTEIHEFDTWIDIYFDLRDYNAEKLGDYFSSNFHGKDRPGDFPIPFDTANVSSIRFYFAPGQDINIGNNTINIQLKDLSVGINLPETNSSINEDNFKNLLSLNKTWNVMNNRLTDSQTTPNLEQYYFSGKDNNDVYSLNSINDPNIEWKLKEIDGKIYEISTGENILWYDFTATTGDTIDLGNDIVYIVDSVAYINSLELNATVSVVLKKMYLTQDIILHGPGGYVDPYTVTWIEGIGDLRGIYKSRETSILHLSTTLVCVNNEDDRLYSNSNYLNCEVRIEDANYNNILTLNKTWNVMHTSSCIPGPIVDSILNADGTWHYINICFPAISQSIEHNYFSEKDSNDVFTLNSTKDSNSEWKLKEIDGKIYEISTGENILWYDFTATTGDTIDLGNDIVYIVDSVAYINSLELNATVSVVLKKMYLSSQGYGSTIWIEGIGDLRGITKSREFSLLVGGSSTLVCVNYEDDKIYSNSNYINCGEIIEELFVSTEVRNISGCGRDNGAIAVHTKGGVEPYSYMWSNGSTSANLINLAEGTYTITVTDALGNSVSATVTVIVEPSGNTRIESDIDTAIFKNSSIDLYVGRMDRCGNTVSIIENAENAQVCSLSIVSSDSVILAYTPNHNFIGTDNVKLLVRTNFDNYDTLNVRINIVNQNNLVILSQITNATINGASDAAVSISVTGGEAPYSYLWSNGSANANLTGIGIGTYTVTVTDAEGFSATETVTVGVNLPGNNSISGTTVSGTNSVTDCAIILYLISGNDFRPLLISEVDASGNYSFVNLPDGRYLLYAVPNPSSLGNLLPTYAYNSLLWNNAYILDLDAVVTNFNINLISLQTIIEGIGLISGNVTVEDSVLLATNTYNNPIFSNNELSSGSDMQISANVIVNLMQNGEIVAWTMTDSNGNFAFNNLPLGVYTLVIEKQGGNTLNQDITLTDESPSVSDLKFSITKNGAMLTSIPNIVQKQSDISFYPIPVGSDLYISGIECISIEIFDANKKLCKQNSNSNHISTKSLQSGSYLVRFTSKNGKKYTKVIIKE